MKTFAIKIDVDTERGTRIGVPNLIRLLRAMHIPATFLFSLGPDNTGRAIKRIFRPGFFKKCSRTSIISTYGIRTLMNGVLLPGPHIAKKHTNIMRRTKMQGFEVGIHCYDHIRWQDGVMKMSDQEVMQEFHKATDEFKKVFNEPAKSAGAPGWQANEKTLAAYDAANLVYGSDCRGTYPFIPKVGKKVFNALQIPTTLPTLDEIDGRDEYPVEKWTEHYLSLLSSDHPNVMTSHAELEGMKYLDWYREFLTALQKQGVIFQPLIEIANNCLTNKANIPVCELIQDEIEGRSGTMAVQAE
jgi:undecaprenyl phosphate-alpha-L-ara4FN deformylase